MEVVKREERAPLDLVSSAYALLPQVPAVAEGSSLEEVDWLFWRLREAGKSPEVIAILRQYAHTFIVRNTPFLNYFVTRTAQFCEAFDDFELAYRLFVFWICCGSKRLRKAGNSFFRALAVRNKTLFAELLLKAESFCRGSEEWCLKTVVFAVLLADFGKLKMFPREVYGYYVGVLGTFLTNRRCVSLSKAIVTFGVFAGRLANFVKRGVSDAPGFAGLKNELLTASFFLILNERQGSEIMSCVDVSKFEWLKIQNLRVQRCFAVTFLNNLFSHCRSALIGMTLDGRATERLVYALLSITGSDNVKVTAAALRVLRLLYLASPASSQIQVFKSVTCVPKLQLSFPDLLRIDPSGACLQPGCFPLEKHANTWFDIRSKVQTAFTQKTDTNLDYLLLNAKTVLKECKRIVKQQNWRFATDFFNFYKRIITLTIDLLHSQFPTKASVSACYKSLEIASISRPEMRDHVALWRLSQSIFKGDACASISLNDHLTDLLLKGEFVILPANSEL